jgi:hypothetical protein
MKRTGRVSRSWLREVQRDLMALGSVIFYLLVLGRALVGPFWDLAIPLLVVGVALLAVQPFLKEADLYLTRALILAVLVTRHYGDVVFGLFAGAAFVLMVLSALALGRSRSSIAQGLVVGVVGSGVALALAEWID